jgi:hypothetical protein
MKSFVLTSKELGQHYNNAQLKTHLWDDSSIIWLDLSELGGVGKCTNKKGAIWCPIRPILCPHIQCLGAQCAPLRVHKPWKHKDNPILPKKTYRVTWVIQTYRTLNIPTLTGWQARSYQKFGEIRPFLSLLWSSRMFLLAWIVPSIFGTRPRREASFRCRARHFPGNWTEPAPRVQSNSTEIDRFVVLRPLNQKKKRRWMDYINATTMPQRNPPLIDWKKKSIFFD